MAQRKRGRKAQRGTARQRARAQLRALGLRILGLPPEASRKPGSELGLIGIDVAGQRRRGRAFGLLSTLAAVLVVALGVSALRIDLLRIRYALGEAIAEEQRLLDEQRSLTAEMRRLRARRVATRSWCTCSTSNSGFSAAGCKRLNTSGSRAVSTATATSHRGASGEVPSSHLPIWATVVFSPMPRCVV